MNNSDIIREVQAERSVLEVKKHLNKIKQTCVEMDDPQNGIKCLREANNFEAEIDQNFTPDEPRHRLERLEEVETPSTAQSIIDQS